MKSWPINAAITAFALMFSISACNDGKNKKAEGTTEDINSPETSQTIFDRLVGTWQAEDGKSFEQWTKSESDAYHLYVFKIKGADTVWSEQAHIYRENDRWVFENTVRSQNDGRPVKFISTILSENSVQFSNPAHDFPTDINYTIADSNTVNALIFGPNNKGGKDTISFNYTRVKK